jgi:hypothetical protein
MAQEIFETTLNGLSFKFYEPTETQLALIGRGAVRADKAGKREDYEAAVYAVSDMLDIIDSLIVEESDREELTKMMSTGKLEVGDLMTAMTDKKEVTETTAKPRVRRGRAN